MNPQQPLPPNNQPPRNPWDFLQSPAEAPKPPSIWQSNKKLIILALVSIGLLLVLLIVSLLAAPSQPTLSDAQSQTDVPLSQYDGQSVALSHATTLQLITDEQLNDDDPTSRYLLFADNEEYPIYTIEFFVSNEEPTLAEGEEAVDSLIEDGQTRGEVTVSDVTLAGVAARKTVGKISDEFGESYIVYTTAVVDGQYLEAIATYPLEANDIIDSLDAMLGSVVLKQATS